MRPAIPSLAVGLVYLASLSVSAASGARISEPALAARRDIIFFEDFDSPHYTSHWRNAHSNGYAFHREPVSFVLARVKGIREALTSNVFFGTGSLECEHHPGTHNPSEMTAVIPGRDCAHIRWYRKWEDGYDWTQHKMPGFYAKRNPRSGGGAGEKPNGTDKFSAKLFVGWDRSPAIYSYHPEQKSGYGDHLKQNVGSRVYLETGRWYCFELMLRANTPPARDGEIKMWINGELKAHYKEMRFRDVPDLKINIVTHSAYVGGTWTSKRRQHLWDDNLVVATGYIGPMQYVVKKDKEKQAERKIFRPRKTRTGPPEEAVRALQDAQKEALEGRFSKAADILDRAASSLEDEHKRPLLEARGAFLAVEGMKWWIIDGLDEGRKKTVSIDLMGNSVRARLVSADEEAVVISLAGSETAIPWEQISGRRLLGILERYTPEEEEAGEQVADLRRALGLGENSR